MTLLDASGRPVAADGLPAPEPSAKLVEVVRSFSFKLNLGNYQSADFFCSQKSACSEADRYEVSAGLYDWCYEQVMQSVNEVRRKQAAKAERSAA